jgi:translation initiation factor 2 subunit 3
LLHVGAAVNVGKILSIKQNVIKVKLTRPICALPGSRVAISRKITARWRLIGYGLIVSK